MSDPTSSAVSAEPGAPAATSSPTTAAAPAPSPMDVAVQNLMARKGMQSIQPPGDEPPATEPLVTTEPAVTTSPAEPAAEPTEPVISAPKNEREYLDRIARKDALYQGTRNELAQTKQQLAEMQRKQDEFFTRFSADPMAVMRERNIRFGDIALQAAGKTPDKKEAPPVALPAEIAAEFEELKRFRAEYQQTQQQRAAQENRDHQVGLVKGLLEKDTQIPLVNELGKYGDVLDRVAKHVGNHGAFADDREAQEVVAFYARQVESEEQQAMRQNFTKPGVKAWLTKELGLPTSPTPQREATPARPEIEGNHVQQTTPRPALSNTITTQRTTAGAPEPWDKERARQQAVAEMNQLAQTQRTH